MNNVYNLDNLIKYLSNTVNVEDTPNKASDVIGTKTVTQNGKTNYYSWDNSKSLWVDANADFEPIANSSVTLDTSAIPDYDYYDAVNEKCNLPLKDKVECVENTSKYLDRADTVEYDGDGRYLLNVQCGKFNTTEIYPLVFTAIDGNKIRLGFTDLQLLSVLRHRMSQIHNTDAVKYLNKIIDDYNWGA